MLAGLVYSEDTEKNLFHTSLPAFGTCQQFLVSRLPFSIQITIHWIQFSSVARACPTLCDPMNSSTPGLPVHHQLLESTQTHVHCGLPSMGSHRVRHDWSDLAAAAAARYQYLLPWSNPSSVCILAVPLNNYTQPNFCPPNFMKSLFKMTLILASVHR